MSVKQRLYPWNGTCVWMDGRSPSKFYCSKKTSFILVILCFHCAFFFFCFFKTSKILWILKNKERKRERDLMVMVMGCEMWNWYWVIFVNGLWLLLSTRSLYLNIRYKEKNCPHPCNIQNYFGSNLPTWYSWLCYKNG